MEKSFSELLRLSGMTRQEFADLCGVSIKTTYWDNPPRYAILVLEQHIELREYKELKVALKNAVGVEIYDLSKY